MNEQELRELLENANRDIGRWVTELTGVRVKLECPDMGGMNHAKAKEVLRKIHKELAVANGALYERLNKQQ